MRGLQIFGVAWAVFILYTAFAIARHPLVQGPIFFTGSVIFVFSLYPMTKKGLAKHWPGPLDALAIISAIVITVRTIADYSEITRTYYIFSGIDVLFSILVLIIAIEGTRRAFGWALPIIVLFFFSYLIWGKFISGAWGHPGVELPSVLAMMYRGSDAYWGTIMWVHSTVVSVFMLFGPVLLASGASLAIMGIANFVGGRIPGGAAQISAISSSLFGTISGSAVGNVSATGIVTIPTMKKVGYNSPFAGAVEAVASTGGQIMPPIMGTAAFIMAEFLGIPYVKIMIAAFIPAVLYYASLMSILFFHGRAYRIGALPQELIPEAREVFAWRRLGTFVIPIVVLLGIIFYTFIPQLAAAGALVTAALLYLATGGRPSLREAGKRLAVIGEALVSGVTLVSGLTLIVVSIQIAVFSITFIGFGVVLSEFVISVGKEYLILALMLSMVAAMVLGMGMGTTAAYVIAIAVVGAPLIKLGIEPLVAHLFVFYYAVLGVITPPVCVAVFAAAVIAKCDWLPLARRAISLALTGFVVPYLFVYQPALIMQGSVQDILMSSITALAAIFALASAGVGFLLRKTTILERIGLGIGGLLLLPTNPSTWNLIGLAVIALILLIQWLRPLKDSRLGISDSV
ncbi:TRAP transporter permease [Chloroflexota bacterium]